MANIAPAEGPAGVVAPLPAMSALGFAPFFALLFQRRAAQPGTAVRERISR